MKASAQEVADLRITLKDPWSDKDLSIHYLYKNDSPQTDTCWILIHGAGSASHAFIPLMNALPESQVYALDLPNFGVSDETLDPLQTDPTMNAADLMRGYARLVCGFMRHLETKATAETTTSTTSTTFNLLGHSWGANLCTYIVREWSGATIDKVILVNPGGLFPLSSPYNHYQSIIVKALPIFQKWFAPCIRRMASPNRLSCFWKRLAIYRPDVALRHISHCVEWGPFAMWSRWKIPCISNIIEGKRWMIVIGLKDPIVPGYETYKMIQAYCTDLTTRLLNGGHSLHYDKAETVASLMMDDIPVLQRASTYDKNNDNKWCVGWSVNENRKALQRFLEQK
jgi:pimeloyl-ACP methyl ester carboxylesterase